MKRKKLYTKWMTAIIWLVIWELAAYFTASVLLLPSPHDTAAALFRLVGEGGFYLNLLSTLMRCAAGIVSSFVIGAIAAVIAFRSYYAREFFRIPVSFFKSIPVMAIVIYVILIAKSDVVSIVVCFLMCFPISYSNILAGLDGMRKEYIELAKVNGLTTGQLYRLVLLPMLRPQTASALNLISGMSWKVVVASEVLSIPQYSIGYEMLKSKYYLETPELFAYIFVLVVLSLLMENAVGRLMNIVDKSTKERLRFGGREDPVTDAAHVSLRNVNKSYSNVDNEGEDERTADEAASRESGRGGTEKVLTDYTETFDKGITAVLGPSGRGKTTLLRLISGLEEPDSGEVISTERVSCLFQEDRLLPWLDTASNMMLGIINEAGMTGEEALSRVKRMAAMLEIESALDMMPHELSGGMSHRAALGRAILRRSELLVLDEPFRGIDGSLKQRLIERLRDEILQPEGKPRTVVLITHEEDVANELASRIIRL